MSFLRVGRDGRVVPSRFVVDWDPSACPECFEHASVSAQGRWGEWHLYEAMCPQGHYWAYDLLTRRKVLALGYRMDRYTGDRRTNLPSCVTEKWYCPPDDKSTPISEAERYNGGRDANEMGPPSIDEVPF